MVRQSIWVGRAASAITAALLWLLVSRWTFDQVSLAQASADGPNAEEVDVGKRMELGEIPFASRGKLLLCGGGELPDFLLSEFHKGGLGERGSLVVIPSASYLSDARDFTRWYQAWASFTWRNVEILHADNREQAEDEGFAHMLRRATAVWISGGDQTRLVERYRGSRVEKEIQGVLQRGGIVGGTSAGSAVATKVMISGGQKQPVLNQGFDLLPRAIVDQHFTQRARHGRLAKAVANHPDRIGIGIDEGTGLYITSREAQVIGKGAVYVYRSLGSKSIDIDPAIDTIASCDQKRFDAGTAIAFSDLPLLAE